MTAKDHFRRFWSERAPRERRMLVIGVALLLLLAVWGVLVEPAQAGRERWQQALPQKRAELAQMRAIASEVSSQPAPATPSPATSAALSRPALERSLQDRGLAAQNLVVSDSGLSASFTDVPFAALAEWLQQTQSSSRLIVTEATLTARDLPGRVDARLSLQHAQ